MAQEEYVFILQKSTERLRDRIEKQGRKHQKEDWWLKAELSALEWLVGYVTGDESVHDPPCSRRLKRLKQRATRMRNRIQKVLVPTEPGEKACEALRLAFCDAEVLRALEWALSRARMRT